MSISDDRDNSLFFQRLTAALALFTIFCAASPLFAGGNADDYAFEPVSGQSHWTYTVDLTGLEEGKYNLVIRSEDSAGNVRLEGPYDFRVDPETDIPSVAVSHPRAGDRVGRMLPIIGTARDDDGIARVEVSINEGTWRPASGKEAWSAVLDAGALGDGAQVLTVRSFDLNGIESPHVSVPFIVDTSVPVGGVTEPVSGARISGKTSFSGLLEDPNGIERLEISRDGGETWESLRFSKDKESGSARFDVGLDSRKLEDGPVVWWFRATDSQRSVAEIPFLFFVDNHGPEITLELPEMGEDGFEAVPGNVFLAGTVTDNSGIESLKIYAGKDDAIEIPLTRGNPWFTWELVFSGRNDKRLDLRIEAVDTAGNVSEQKYRIPINSDADAPRLSIDGFERFPGFIFQHKMAYLTGLFSDDDGPGSIRWQSGDLEGLLESVERSWRLELPDLPIETSKIKLTPIDRFAVVGESIEIEFLIAPPAPLITLGKTVVSGVEQDSAWAPGMIIPYAGGIIHGSLISAAGRDLKLVYTEASGAGGSGEEKALSMKSDPENPKRRSFQIPVKKGSEPGVHNFIIRAFDGYGAESLLGSAFYVQGEPDENGVSPDPRNGDQAVNIPLPQLRESDGAAILRSGQPLQGFSSGASTVGARFEPESRLVRLRSSGTSFTIEAVKPGLSEPIRVVLADGSTSEPIVLLTDLEAPRWEMDSPMSGAWSAGGLSVSGTVVDEGGVASAEWSADGMRFNPIEIEEKGDGRFVFAFDAELSGRPDGPLLFTLRSSDLAGNQSLYELPVMLDTTSPTLVMDLPPSGRPVGAKSTLVYSVPGDELLEEMSLSIDGETWIKAAKASRYALDLNLAGFPELPETLTVRAIDRAGNIIESQPNLAYDPVSDKPRTVIQTPVDQSVVRGATDFSGLVSDEDAISEINWRIDGGAWQKLPGDASFRTALPLERLEDGTHIVEAFAEDAAGNVGEIDGSSFLVTRREPQGQMLKPAMGTASRGRTILEGTAVDDNGIAEVWVSFDNGNTYARADGKTDYSPAPEPAALNEKATDDAESSPTDGDSVLGEGLDLSGEPVPAEGLTGPFIYDDTVNWQYSLDTSVLDDGVHTLLIKVIDGAGDVALLAGLLEVDNKAPLLSLGTPVEGSVQTGSMVLEGRVVDAGDITSFSAVLERDGEKLLEYNEPTEGVFHLPFSFKGLEAGEVLLRVEAADRAGNTSAVSRSFSIEPGRRVVVGEITLPVEGEVVGPVFSFSGRVKNVIPGKDKAMLFVDGVNAGELYIDSRGRIHREFGAGDLTPGDHQVRVDISSGEGEVIEGEVRRFSYEESGAWIVLDGYPPGFAVGGRPLLTGRSGYFISEPDENDKDAVKAYQKEIRANKPDRVELSLDGGLSFEKAKGTKEWEYRIETGEMSEGDLSILVRARFPDGWTYARTLLHLDKTPPDLKLNETIADGRFNDSLELSGISSDDRELESVTVSVRDGSQNLYRVPAFIQGLYFNASVFGATWADAGLGVTFFDDNVKLELHAGWAPEEVYDSEMDSMVSARVSGITVGAKLLANVVYLPLGYFFGPNWDRMSFSLAVGANFSYFSDFGVEGGGMMSSVVAQMEIPKIEFPDRKFITYLAPYLEGQLWFFSSDVNTTPFFTGSIGLRLGLL